MKVKYPLAGGPSIPAMVQVPIPDRGATEIRDVVSQNSRVAITLIGRVEGINRSQIVLELEEASFEVGEAVTLKSKEEVAMNDKEVEANPEKLAQKAKMDAGGLTPRGPDVVRKSEAELVRSEQANGEKYDANGRRVDIPAGAVTPEPPKADEVETMSAREAQDKAAKADGQPSVDEVETPGEPGNP